VSQQSIVLIKVRILKNNPFQRARRVGTVNNLPFGKILKILLIHVPGECKRVLEASNPDIRGETIIPEAEQNIGFQDTAWD